MSRTALFHRRSFFATTICLLSSLIYAEDPDRSRYPAFNVSKDILIAQYDNRKDTDDIHAQAALGCILAHPDGQGVNVYAVQHCYDSNDYLKSSDPLFDEIWGRDGWTDAIHEADKTKDEMVKQHGEGYIFNGNREISLERVYERALQVLLAGGRVWIADGGPSGFTQNWLQALIDRDNGIGAGDTQSRVFLVQHSRANENGTSEEDLTYVKANSNYVKIADGNRENTTPGYRSLSKDNPDKKHMRSATSFDNPNHYARTLWTLAQDAVENSGHKGYYNGWIDNGGVDFSDCVENWWILDLGDPASTLDLFWERYVVNVPSAPSDLTPTIATTSLPHAVVGVPYAFPLVANSGDAPLSWSVVNGALPSGLSFGADGMFIGTPAAPALSTLLIQVEDTDGDIHQRELVLTVVKEEVDLPPVAVLTASATEVYVGDVISFDGSGSTDDNGITKYRYRIDGTTLQNNSTPSYPHTFTAAGTYVVELRVQDALTQRDTDVITVKVIEPASPTRVVTFVVTQDSAGLGNIEITRITVGASDDSTTGVTAADGSSSPFPGELISLDQLFDFKHLSAASQGEETINLRWSAALLTPAVTPKGFDGRSAYLLTTVTPH